MVVAGSLVFAATDDCEGEKYQQFDFWVGSWEVSVSDGTLAGHNEVRREQGGCLLVENWRNTQGGTGTSLNFYNPVDDQWRQVWVSAGSNIDIVGGLTPAGMVLEGFITYLAQAERFAFRATWTLQPDGRVRQFFEEAREPGVWKPWFEGFYARSTAPD